MSLGEGLRDVLGPAPTDPSARYPLDRIETRLLLGGLQEASDGGVIVNVDPVSGSAVGSAADATPEDAVRAVALARAALEATPWSSDVALRARCLGQLVDGLRRHADELRTALVTDIGCPVRMTYADQMAYAVDKLAYYVDLVGGFPFAESLPDLVHGASVTRRSLHRVPLGVVVAISPWNLPLELMLAKVGGALAGGNALIVKPSPLAPWTATTLARVIAEETDLPRGIVSILPSGRLDTVEALTTSRGVDAVAFTGSTQTGVRVMEAASATIKRVCLELGGKSPSVFLPDAPLEDVLPFAAGMSMFNSGQSCIMPSRFLVPAERFDECLDLASAGLAAVSVGDPWSPDTFMGPLISAERRDAVLGVVERAVDGGARVVTGGDALPGPGYFMAPTLLADLEGTTAASREEIFGPVLTMTPYRSVDEARERANDTDFGLAGYVWSADPEAAVAFGAGIRAGMIGVNGGQFTAADMPFGGMRSSGVGREWGRAGLEEFLDWQSRSVRL
jgi:acyl-CoA reductase-like NAD-dependent aldehyde dehydrogenase